MRLILLLTIPFILAGFLLTSPSQAFAKPKTGRKAAEKYFSKRGKAKRNSRKSTSKSRRPSSAGAPRYLAIHLGVFIDEETYKWGKVGNDDVGKMSAGVTYRLGEWGKLNGFGYSH